MSYQVDDSTLGLGCFIFLSLHQLLFKKDMMVYNKIYNKKLIKYTYKIRDQTGYST